MKKKIKLKLLYKFNNKIWKINKVRVIILMIIEKVYIVY